MTWMRLILIESHLTLEDKDVYREMVPYQIPPHSIARCMNGEVPEVVEHNMETALNTFPPVEIRTIDFLNGLANRVHMMSFSWGLYGWHDPISIVNFICQSWHENQVTWSELESDDDRTTCSGSSPGVIRDSEYGWGVSC